MVNAPLSVVTTAVYVLVLSVQLGGACAKVTVRGELPSAAGHGVAPVSAAPAMVVGNGVNVVVGTFGSRVVAAATLEVGTVLSAAEPPSPRLISHTRPEMATAAMGIRTMYMPVRLRLWVRAWRAKSSKRC